MTIPAGARIQQAKGSPCAQGGDQGAGGGAQAGVAPRDDASREILGGRCSWVVRREQAKKNPGLFVSARVC